MNENRIMKQVNSIFGLFMVIFYLGFGIYLMFFFKSTLNSAVIKLFAGALIVYGIYRAYTTYLNFARLFFRKDDPNEQAF